MMCAVEGRLHNLQSKLPSRKPRKSLGLSLWSLFKWVITNFIKSWNHNDKYWNCSTENCYQITLQCNKHIVFWNYKKGTERTVLQKCVSWCRMKLVEQSPLKNNKSQFIFSKRLQTQIKWISMKYCWVYYLTLLGPILIKLSHFYTWVKKQNKTKNKEQRHRTSASCGLFHFI